MSYLLVRFCGQMMIEAPWLYLSCHLHCDEIRMSSFVLTMSLFRRLQTGDPAMVTFSGSMLSRTAIWLLNLMTSLLLSPTRGFCCRPGAHDSSVGKNWSLLETHCNCRPLMDVQFCTCVSNHNRDAVLSFNLDLYVQIILFQ